MREGGRTGEDSCCAATEMSKLFRSTPRTVRSNASAFQISRHFNSNFILSAKADSPTTTIGRESDDIRAAQLFQQGVEAFNEGDSFRSRRLFEEAAIIKPTSDTYYNLGNTLYLSREFDGALEAWQKALKLNPSAAADIHTNLANVLLLHKKDVKTAISHYEASLALLENDGQVIFNLAAAYESLGDVESLTKAVSLYAKAEGLGIDAKKNLRNAAAKLAGKQADS